MVKDKEGVSGIRPFVALLFFLLLGLTTASHSEDAENGVLIVDFNTPKGSVKVFLPDDISAGDTVSAAIKAYPSGNTQNIKNKNLSELNGYSIETGFFRVTVGEKAVKISVPKNMAGTKMKFTLRDSNMKSLGSVSIPIGLSSPIRRYSDTPSPFDYQCPLVGQAGRLVEIKGPFDGDFATTDLQIGNKKVDVIAESPREMVFESPPDIVGSVEVVMTERGVVVNRPFTCLRVMKIGESGAVAESRSATGGEAANVSPSSRAGTTEGAAEPELKKEIPQSGTPKRELPPGTHTLQFESIKGEETLEPSEPVSKPSSVPAADRNEDLGAILTRQLDSPVSLENSPVSASPVSETGPRSSAGENVPAISAGGSLKESPITSGPEAVEGKVAVVTVPPAAVSSDNIDHTGIADSGSEARIIEGQLLASFTGGTANGTAPQTHKNNKVEHPASPKHKGSFTVQVASSRDKKDADGMASRLRKKGYDAFVVPADISGKGKWYRVRVGMFPTKDEAASFAASLKMKERFIKSAFVSAND